MFPLGSPFCPASHYRPGLSEHSIAFFRSHQIAPNRIAQHLFGVGQVELTHPAGSSDQIHDRVGNGAAKDLRDPRQDLHQ